MTPPGAADDAAPVVAVASTDRGWAGLTLEWPALPRRHRADGTPIWSKAILLGAALLVGAPIASLLRLAFSADASAWTGLVGTVLPDAFLETVLLLGGVAAGAGTIGLGTAWLVTAYRFPGRGLLAWALPLPLAVPTYITAYVYAELFDAAGPVQRALRSLMGWTSRAEHWFPEVRSLPGCILVMSLVLYPYVYLAARAVFIDRSPAMLATARTLGAGPFALFRLVALPLARPALAVGLSLALLEALNDIGAVEYLGVRTLTLTVYTTWLNRGSLPAAAQLACLMLAMVVLLMWAERRGRGQRGYAEPGQPRFAAAVALEGWGRSAALALCAAPVLLGLALPGAYLVMQVAERGLLAGLDRAFLGHLGTTLALAAAATILALLVAIVVVTACRFAKQRTTDALAFVVGLGYALPGTVLVLGLLGPLVAFDAVLGAIWSRLTGDRPGLFLMGSAAGVACAYLVRFLPIATGTLSAGMAQVPEQFEDAARVAGANSRRIVLSIQLPLLRPALASAALLVFVDCLKELPATLLLRPLATETLATLVYGAASRGAFEDGSLAALIIVAVGIWPVLQLTRGAEARSAAEPPGAIAGPKRKRPGDEPGLKGGRPVGA